MATYSKAAAATLIESISSEKKQLYLHVGPSGDSWIGDAIFAAKHNQPGYVKSIPLVDDNDDNNNHAKSEDEGDFLIEVLEEHPEWAQEIYDTECLPEALQQHIKSFLEEGTK